MATETDAAYDMQAKRLLGHKVQIIINVEAQKDDELREELSEMCNLSQGVKEEGRKEGRAEGRAEGRGERNATISLHMYKKGYALEEIAELTEQSVEEVRELVLCTSSR